jgi:ribosome-associated protein
MKHRPVPEPIVAAVEAAEEKQAVDLVLLDLGEHASFTDYFLISSARNSRQSQAICDEIQQQLARVGCRAVHMEGYHQGEWILMDYGFLVVHIFSEKARSFYDLERLWRTARKVTREEAH